MYLFVNFYNPPRPSPPNPLLIDLRDDLSCRQKICHWTYSVVDHFHLSRETVAISIDLFDRYFATKGNKCDANTALLVSLTTLNIAAKVTEKKKFKISFLAELSRNSFSPNDIRDMETKILSTLSWLVHPPTPMDFVNELMEFMPVSVSSKACQDILELVRYNTEVAVCDSYFIEHDSSSIALAAILNVLQDDVSFDIMPRKIRTTFLRQIFQDFPWFTNNLITLQGCKRRLREIQLSGSEENKSVHNSKRAVSPMSVARGGISPY